MTQRSELPSWKALKHHHDNTMRDVKIKDLFAQDPNRFEDFHVQHETLLFDYSKNRVTHETLDKLYDLAGVCALEDWRARMFRGDVINLTEKRSVLHTALRCPRGSSVMLDGRDIMPDVHDSLDRMKKLSDDIRETKCFEHIVNIGIGGSDLGPSMACRALKAYSDRDISVHFVSNSDAANLTEVLYEIDAEKTLFIVTSKTFTTLETMTNAQSARAWMQRVLDKDDVSEHFIAVTQNTQEAKRFGIPVDNIYPMWDWVGGRFSVWSSVGLSLCISIGFENFSNMLAGAHSMDEHFKKAPIHANMPILLGLIGVWNRNFCGYNALSMVPYSDYLSLLPAYMQQLDMESNGKSVTRDQEHVLHQTSPIIMGSRGTNAQHAYFQQFHQGQDIVPCDFIAFARSQNPLGKHHQMLLANMMAQSKALMEGYYDPNPIKNFEGNRPSNTIVADELTPYTLGMIMALYEHKIFVQGVIWNVNSFDQYGVELGKKMARSIMNGDDDIQMETDSSTEGLLSFFKRYKNS